MDLSELLAFAVKNGASDIHISADLPPLIRIDGDIRRIKVDSLSSSLVHDMIYDIMLDSQRKEFEERWETDFAFELPNIARFRGNAFNQDRGHEGSDQCGFEFHPGVRHPQIRHEQQQPGKGHSGTKIDHRGEPGPVGKL